MPSTGKVGDTTLIAAIHMSGKRLAERAEGGALGRGRDDGESVGVGAKMFDAQSAQLREQSRERYEVLLFTRHASGVKEDSVSHHQ